MIQSVRDVVIAIFFDAMTLVSSWAMAPAPEGETMKPSVTYVHLLRHTPFFTNLNIDQLRWVVEHSREWEVQPSTAIVTREAGEASTDDAIWVLLDGKWCVEENGRRHESGNSTAGKWFSAAEIAGPVKLVVTEHSYVMKITRADFNTMLAQGFDFRSHLLAGENYYRVISPPHLLP
ncbi:hypothetical protein FD776_13545 [Klebsiella pneumoniae]|uniref:hypothetical protein n=1 Tax=Klebsiella pneumoniae TaxID=573 RepID=UPI001BA55C8B|nr:hypothetical protein [Klebsiella pneumoniae]MBQ5265171.1 hypothetical protein [Klebsiella pneumoniae]